MTENNSKRLKSHIEKAKMAKSQWDDLYTKVEEETNPTKRRQLFLQWQAKYYEWQMYGTMALQIIEFGK